MTVIAMISRNTQNVLATFDETSNVERLVDSLIKFDCFGIGPDMIKRIGELAYFFEDSEEGTPVPRILLSNNALMVLFNITTELLAQNTSNMRMTHSRILYKRKTVEDKKDRTIGQNMRSDVIYNDTAMLAQFLSIITPLIFSGDSLIVTESAE